MAMKQGRCPNCGSLLMVNDQDAKSVCMFCHARFSPVRAIEIDQNPDDVEFPDEPQEDLTDEEQQIAFSSVRSVQVTHAPKRQQPPQRKKKKVEPGKLTAQQKVAMQKKDLIEPKVSKKHRQMLAGIIGSVVVLFVAIFLPITINRVSKGNDLDARISDIAVFEVPNEGYYEFSGFRNTSLLLVSPVDLTVVEVEEIMDNFKAVRADIYDLGENQNQNSLELRISAPNGIFTRRGNE